ncbi:glycosyltransferase, partial [bacterium]|nr:glycosyltransferase [bacterium]
IRPRPECEPRSAWPQRQGPDVGFMGALAAQRYQKVLEFWQRRDAEYVRILDGIVEDYLADPTRSLEERYNASPGRDRLPYAGFVVLYLEERVTYLKRVRTLHCVNDLGLVTYGAGEWKEPAWAENLVDCYSGEMPRYREDLPRVYYHTKININIFHAQCINSTNPRVYDVLAAGGFLLTEYKPILEEEFQQEKHLVWYHSPEEMREKVVYYLEQEEEREAIARAGQEYVLQHATYKQRIQTMIDTIENDKTQT